MIRSNLYRLRGPIRSRLRTAAVGFSYFLLAALPLAMAQYAYSPNNADELVPGVRYFGSAKDSDGALLPGVTVVLKLEETSFILVTDEQGRFRHNLPLQALSKTVTVTCSKPGLELVSVVRRPGLQGAPKPTVQVDCLLRQAGPPRNGAQH